MFTVWGSCDANCFHYLLIFLLLPKYHSVIPVFSKPTFAPPVLSKEMSTLSWGFVYFNACLENDQLVFLLLLTSISLNIFHYLPAAFRIKLKPFPVSSRPSLMRPLLPSLAPFHNTNPTLCTAAQRSPTNDFVPPASSEMVSPNVAPLFLIPWPFSA